MVIWEFRGAVRFVHATPDGQYFWWVTLTVRVCLTAPSLADVQTAVGRSTLNCYYVPAGEKTVHWITPSPRTGVTSASAMDSLFRWITAGIFVITSPFTAIGAYEAYQTHTQLRDGQRLPGTVIDNRLTTDRRDGVEEHAYQPEVSFRSPDGAVHHFTDPAGSLPADYAVGDPVTVLYAARQPQNARIVSWKRLWLVPTLLVVVGLLPGAIVWGVLSRVSRATGR